MSFFHITLCANIECLDVHTGEKIGFFLTFWNAFKIYFS
jgi:hypothetical protein